MASTLALPHVDRRARALGPVQKRVALFTGAYNHIADGVSRTLNRLVAFLEREGAAVRVFGPSVADPPVEHAGTLIPVPSIAAPGRSEYRVSSWLPPALRSALLAFRPNILHVATPDVLGLSALRFGRRTGIPVVASYHTHFSSYLKYYKAGLLEPLMWRYLRWFYGQCEHVYVPSTSMQDVLRAHGIRQGLLLWKRGVDTTLFSPARRSAQWRQAQGFGHDEVVVAFIGRLVWEKGLSTFAEVIRSLVARGIRHRSLVVGDGPARRELGERLPDTTFTGYLEGEELARAYASSDLFLFPSDTETFGNVTLEAMASGLPAVCADATGSDALVEDGTTGILVEPGNVDGFADAVIRLLVDEALRLDMGHAAVARAREYEWETVLSRILCYYDDLLAGRGDESGDGFGDESRFPEAVKSVLAD